VRNIKKEDFWREKAAKRLGIMVKGRLVWCMVLPGGFVLGTCILTWEVLKRIRKF
jgi:hypothetical protein